MLVSTLYRVDEANWLKTELTGAIFEVYGGAVAATADAATAGAKLAASTALTAGQITANAAGDLTITAITDSVIDANGTPTHGRFIKNGGGVLTQVTLKMSAAAGSAEGVLTDADDANATQILANRKLTLNATLT